MQLNNIIDDELLTLFFLRARKYKVSKQNNKANFRKFEKNKFSVKSNLIIKN